MTMRDKLIASVLGEMPMLGRVRAARIVDGVLGAMREPDDEMVRAGNWQLGPGNEATARFTFTAMIDHVREG